MSESAIVTVTRSVTTAAGVYAPGHLGELTRYLPVELVDDVWSHPKTLPRRLRTLPSRVGVFRAHPDAGPRAWVGAGGGS